jgi:hypothetical protein
MTELQFLSEIFTKFEHVSSYYYMCVLILPYACLILLYVKAELEFLNEIFTKFEYNIRIQVSGTVDVVFEHPSIDRAPMYLHAGDYIGDMAILMSKAQINPDPAPHVGDGIHTHTQHTHTHTHTHIHTHTHTHTHTYIHTYTFTRTYL